MIKFLHNKLYDPSHAVKYYYDLVKGYQHLHWHWYNDHPDHDMVDPKNHIMDMHGWGLQTIYKDLQFPYHIDIDPHDDGPELFKNTELVFGFADSLLFMFPTAYRPFVLVLPPGNFVGRWKPPATQPKHDMVFVPITTNDNCILKSHTTPVVQDYQLQPGIPVATTTDVDTELYNNGDTDLVFILLNLPIGAT